MLTDTAARAADRVETARRLLVSARTPDSPAMPVAQVPSWLAERARAGEFRVTRVPFAQLRGWYFEEGTGDLRHESGRFFAVEGLHVHADALPAGGWRQPIIVQPEVGLLGIVAREIDGVLHFLMQAKMEPGNINTLQLSPTVQATRSNFTGVHKGRPIPHLDLFLRRGRARVLVDVLQSEQADWFLAKRNRNMIIEVDEDIETGPEFRWLTFGQLLRLLHLDNVVNMDTRSILACLPTAGAGDGASAGPVLRSFHDPSAASRHTMPEILSWLTGIRALRELVQRRIPLDAVAEDGWRRTGEEIGHDSGRRFRVIGADIRASNREVASWSQPLIQPQVPGLMALVVKRIGGTLHALVQARVDVGHLNVAELAPTVHCRPADHTGPGTQPFPPFLADVLAAPAGRVRYDAVQSEEGGRFYHAENRYVIVEAPDAFTEDVPDDYAWLTFAQLTELLAYGNQLNVELRTLVVCAHTLY
ncbi:MULTISPECIES: NDP-hexose 2,3-dehydratase family protein [unclassified Streptomyces]|uniref:NDP-hexose 2,3-dehydratase family protein n=1 Tax=unclassified Streptomyces TaxID=2593676 RepID=UPI002E31E7CC|nr:MULTISPECIES: NDP-hexose 2,3-dehydratase family protein [unclassified Streptomyces]WUC69068.1 NDP-hexose 2,3-dehydratase family protein [Streptomyces sp. NBC_00539]